MVINQLLLCLLGLSALFVGNTVAFEAIIGGTKAGIDQFPFQVSLTINKRNICGGGLITDQHVLTAAHCIIAKENIFKDFTEMRVLVGANYLKSTSVRALTVEIETAYVPVGFSNVAEIFSDDIAVIKLKEAFKRNSIHKYLQLLKLPGKHDIHSGKTVRIAGFGWDRIETVNNEVYGKNSDDFLHYSDALILSNKQCQRDYPNHKHLVTDKLMCAQLQQYQDTSKDSGVCVGDNGSPLVINQTFKAVGILSTGPHGCIERQTAAVYTRVSHYLEFINNAVKGIHHKGIRTA